MSNVLRLTPKSERFERPGDFALGDYWSRQLDEFDRKRLARAAVVRVSPDPAGWTTVDLPVEPDDVAARPVVGVDEPAAGRVSHAAL